MLKRSGRSKQKISAANLIGILGAALLQAALSLKITIQVSRPIHPSWTLYRSALLCFSTFSMPASSVHFLDPPSSYGYTNMACGCLPIIYPWSTWSARTIPLAVSGPLPSTDTDRTSLHGRRLALVLPRCWVFSGYTSTLWKGKIISSQLTHPRQPCSLPPSTTLHLVHHHHYDASRLPFPSNQATRS